MMRSITVSLMKNLLNSTSLSLVEKLQNKQLPIFQKLSETQNKLIVTGQGIVVLKQKKKLPFTIYLTEHEANNFPGYALAVTQKNATFYRLSNGEEIVLCNSKSGTGIDQDEKCSYWFSIDSINCCLRYGKGEQREQTTIMKYSLEPSNGRSHNNEWIERINYIKIINHDQDQCNAEEVSVWRDPVTTEPALLIFPIDAITMEMAANYNGTVVENLTNECQKLYANVAGQQFQLNTPDFPYFSEAIEQSIQNPKGWCYQTLKNKEKEFGEPPNTYATYLRITLGVNQGESPGIPYVMEIWPSGHYSPIHNHAGANAVIKVLHGEITVRLFDMLSVSHTTPFKTVTIKKGDITWITSQLNQTHKLHNEDSRNVCVTIQCYLYNIEDNSHYEYFDYINNDGSNIEKFLPNSDMDFLAFKQQMKQEWESNKGGMSLIGKAIAIIVIFCSILGIAWGLVNM